MNRHLEAIGIALEKEWRNELETLRQRPHQTIINTPCDTSAIAPEHHSAFKHGHKQARHAILDAVCEIFAELGV